MIELRQIKNSCFILLLFCTACYENIEGCLEVDATNFDVTADVECDDCCTLPRISINFLHRLRAADRDTFFSLNLNTPLTLDSIHYFKLENIRFYISDFKLVRSTGDLIGVNDEVDLLLLNGTDSSTLAIEDNFALVNRASPSAATIGETVESGDFVGAQFELGVSSPANLADPAFFPSNHPLSYGDSTLYFSQDSGYVFNQLRFFRDTTAADTIALVGEYGLIENLCTITFDQSITLKRGFNTAFTFRIDYREWFKDVDFKIDTPDGIMTKIKAGLTQSFELVAVNFSN